MNQKLPPGCAPVSSSLNRDEQHVRLPPLLAPLAFLLTVSLVIIAFDVDQHFSALFFQSERSWIHTADGWVQLLYHYGNLPALITGILGLAVILIGRFHGPVGNTSRPAAFLVLLLILGPGLIINGAFKRHFGRPRPAEVRSFEGTEEFIPVLRPNLHGHGHSFPSGHASMGYYFLGLYVFYYQSNLKRARWFLGLGLAYGSVMGLARVFQGAHWFSDILWSAGFIYLTAWTLGRCGLVASPTSIRQRHA